MKLPDLKETRRTIIMHLETEIRRSEHLTILPQDVRERIVIWEALRDIIAVVEAGSYSTGYGAAREDTERAVTHFIRWLTERTDDRALVEESEEKLRNIVRRFLA